MRVQCTEFSCLHFDVSVTFMFFFIKMFISWYIKFNFVYNSYYIAEVQHVNNIIFLECYVLFIMGYKLTEVKLNMSRFG